jgi:excisionase family DNA binding protein
VTDSVFSLEDPLLTVDDVAAALGLNQQTVRNYIDDGVLPAVRVGNRRVRIRRSALDAFLAAGETPDLVRGVAALEEARRRLARAVKSTEGLSDEERSELAAALDALAGAQQRFADVLAREQSA